jgi:hypothetical protein
MPTAFFVSGPTKIQVNTGSGYVDLGVSDNDNLPQVTYTDNIHEIKTVSSGAVGEEFVVQNIAATITVTLVKWDQSVLNTLLTDVRGGPASPYSAIVGRLLVNDGAVFGVKILPTTNGKTAYTFGRCYIMADAVVHSNFGNVEQRMALTFRAVPDGSNVLASTATT